jgi:HlyD family secretion protein
MKADLRESELSAAIQQKDLDELQRKLQKADIQATHAGVLTWVNKSVGSKVAEGEALARLADLSGYKVTASISDRYAERLAVDMPVLVRINDEVLQGRLTNIHPSVANNVVTFEVGLQDKSNAALRPSMKVEVYIVTESRANAVRVVNGPAFKGGAEQDVFVLRADGKAERRRVVVGLSNFNYVEIVSGVMPGEQVIISDLSSYRHVRELSITQ